MEKKQVVRLGWSTDDEKEFIDGLGSHRTENDTPRLILLARYLECCSKRSDWGEMNKDKIIKYLKDSIEREGGIK